MTWGVVAVSAAAVGGAIISSDASSSAAKTQAAAADRSTALTQQQFDTTRNDTVPYRAAGASGLNYLQQLLGIGSSAGAVTFKGQNFDSMDHLRQSLVNDYASKGFDPNTPDYQASLQSVLSQATPTPDAGGQASSPLMRKFSVSDFWNDPVVQASYQSGLDLGTKALKNAAPLTTGLDSGAALKELTKFGTDYTGNMAAGSQARFVGDQGNQFNKLAALAGIGQTGVNTSAAAGTNASTNAANIIGSNANAQGAAKIAGANAFSGGLTSVSNYWQQQQMLNQLKPAGGSTAYSNPPANNWAE